MNKATLQCIWMDKVTLWEFKSWISEQPKIYMIAPPWKDNQKDMSCIPQGLYNVTRHESKPRFRILNVPGRDYEEIHFGNYACDVMLSEVLHKSDSLGCFMPGFGYLKSTPMVTESVKAMDWLLDNITENFAMEVRFNLPPKVE